MTGQYDVVVVGGGIVGLACAWRLQQAGAAVVVVDPNPGRGASWAAAGMLAPVTEATYGEEALLHLGLAAAARWPQFATELAAAAGQTAGLREAGTLVLAHDRADKAELDRFADYATRLGLTVTALNARACRDLEPLLAPDIRGGLQAADHSVHNRDTVAALLAATSTTGVRLHRGAVRALRVDAGAVTGVDCADGTEFTAPTVVLAAGSWSPLLPGLPAAAVPAVRPVRGTILRLATPPDYLRNGGVLRHTVRGTVAGSHVYLVPREDGEIVIGATSDEVGYDDRPTAGGVWELLRDARLLLPVLAELTFVEAWSGLRPTTPDGAPLVGPSGVPGLITATGHGRNGVLLAPLTADAVTELVCAGSVPTLWEPFTPQRFASAQQVTPPPQLATSPPQPTGSIR